MTRENIDAQLAAAGWIVQDRSEIDVVPQTLTANSIGAAHLIGILQSLSRPRG